MEDVSKIYETKAIQQDKQSLNAFEKKKIKDEGTRKLQKKHLPELLKIAEDTHKELEEKDSPFRICIYQDGEDVFIDVVTIDESGHIDQIFKHDISHDELENIVTHIKSGRGLILDADV